MKKLYKNNYGVASPLEFSIASVALISTLAVVVASMSPPVEQASAQLYADANAKATEIMSLLLTSNSEVGLAIDPEISVPIPPTESITDITIYNSPPYADTPDPGHGTVVAGPSVTLSVVVHDADVDPQDPLTVYFYNANGDLEIGNDGGFGGQKVQCNWDGLLEGEQYSWYVKVNDTKVNIKSITWSFTTMSNPSPPPPPPPQNQAPEAPQKPESADCDQVCPIYYTGIEFRFFTKTKDPDGDRVRYGWNWTGAVIEACVENYKVDKWTDLFKSDEICIETNIWTVPGKYRIRVMAQDEGGLNSTGGPCFNGWSDYLEIEVITNSPGPQPEKCFLSGTQILMADGSQKNIEDIQIGDMVTSYDEKTNTLQNDRVTEIYHDMPDQMISDYYLIVNNHLKVTPNHHLYVSNKWKVAGDFEIGDQLFKGKVTSLEKIYEKVPAYNFETEKYHTYLVIFGENIVIAHNDVRNYNHVLTGNEEEISLTRQSSVNENDYTALLSMDKIFKLSEISYKELKEILRIPDEYEFYITIGNEDSVFLNYMPDPSITLDSASVVATCRENIIIADSVGYAYATIAVTVVR